MDGTTDGEVAQKTVEPSKCDVNTLTVHLLGSNVFFLLVILLHKRRFSSNSIILFGLVCFCIDKRYAAYMSHMILVWRHSKGNLRPSHQLTILLYGFLGFTGGFYFAGSFSPQFMLMSVVPST